MSNPVLTVFDDAGNAIMIEAIQGPQGEQGPPGADYVLTDADKQTIAELVLDELPTWTGGSY